MCIRLDQASTEIPVKHAYTGEGESPTINFSPPSALASLGQVHRHSFKRVRYASMEWGGPTPVTGTVVTAVGQTANLALRRRTCALSNTVVLYSTVPCVM